MEHFLFRLFMQSLLFSSLLLRASATNVTRDRNVVGDSLVSKRDLIRLTREIEAIYQFGDSLSDTGNYIREVNGEESTYSRLPYGQSYHPTGRASDGLIMVDYIAMFFHLPLLSPYLAKGSDFRHGANFAVIGATANGKYNSLARQLVWFKYHLMTTYHNSMAIKRKLQKSLVLMGEIGGNDFNGPFNQGKSIKEVAKLVPGVVQTIKNAIEEVIKLGATNIVVPGNFPIGCVPLYLAKFATNDKSKYDKLGCLKDYNNFAKFYNIKLIQAIKQLQQKHPDVAIVYGDYYSALIWVIANARQLGIEQDETTKACCGYGYNPYNFGTTGCGSPGSPICQDPSKRISWDGIHLTQQGYKGVGDQLLEQFVPVLEKQIRRRLKKPIRSHFPLSPFMTHGSTLPIINWFSDTSCELFDAIYQFGDSLSDTGNYVLEPKSNTVYNRLPYGQTTHPTGRASDGLIMVDYIASYFNLPQLNPYLATGSDFTHGANFAIIGATANGGLNDNSLAKELDWFKTHLNSTYSNPAAIKEKLQKSLVLMGEIGGNDFNGPFFQGQPIEEVSKLVPGVIKTIHDAVEEVISLGATNIVVPGNFPIGCVPIYLVKHATNDTSKYDELHCLIDYNNFAKSYNQQLLQAITQLQNAHPDVAIVYGDYYAALTSVITNAQQLGFEEGGTEKACCGTGNNPYNYGDKSCGSPGAQVCPNPSKRVNWDGVHMTQEGNKNVGQQLIKQFVSELRKHIRKRRSRQ